MTEVPPPPADGSPYATPPPGYVPPPVGGQPPAGYGPPGNYGLQPKNGLGTAALVLGIIALVLCWTIFVGFICGLLALIFGIIGRRRVSRHEATNGGAALAGAITGGLGLAASIAIIAAGAAFFVSHKNDFKNYNDCINHAQTQQDLQQCADDFNRSVTG
jgi:hypothetical protein